MKIRATIDVLIEAGDYIVAAGHQQQVQAFFRELSRAYPQASINFRAVRERTGQPYPPERRPQRMPTGNAAQYEDG